MTADDIKELRRQKLIREMAAQIYINLVTRKEPWSTEGQLTYAKLAREAAETFYTKQP